MGPERRTTRLMIDPRVSSCQRDWRVEPRMSWVAFSERANRMSAAATSSPAISWYVPPTSANS